MDPHTLRRPVDGEEVIFGARTRLRPISEADVAPLVRIRSTPEVDARWRGTDVDSEVCTGLTDADLHVLVIETLVGEVIGAIQWAASHDDDYPHASVDVYRDPAVHHQGLGADAVGALCRFLLTDGGFIAS